MNEVVQAAYTGHTSEIKAIQRNPHLNKTFMTVGTYTIRLWSEEVKDMAIFFSPYQYVQTTDGYWSPTRPTVFITSNCDGCLTFWDLLYCQDDPVLSMKVSALPLTRLKIREGAFVDLPTRRMSGQFCRKSQGPSEA